MKKIILLLLFFAINIHLSSAKNKASAQEESTSSKIRIEKPIVTGLLGSVTKSSGD